jgi:hypothetical protein
VEGFNKEREARMSQAAYLRLQSCLGLIWSSDLGCVSLRTSGKWTGKLRLCLGVFRQGTLQSNGFGGIRPAAPAWFSEVWNIQSVVLGTSQ